MGNTLNNPQQSSGGVGTQTNDTAQNLFEFDEIAFDSRFDSGNLMLATKWQPGRYELWIAPDCYKTQYEANNCVWFYFKVSRVDLQGAPKRTIGFKLKNMKRVEYNNYARQGMVPVYCSPSNGGEWQYLPTPLNECKIVGPNLELKFSYTFNELESKEGVYFAFTFPYTYTDCINYVTRLEEKYTNHPNIYFHRELLTHSHEGRRIDLLTITGHDHSVYNPQQPNLEPLLPNLFPTHPQNLTEPPTLENRHSHRPFVFKNKQYVFFSARIHPGEPPANFMLEGLLNCLLNLDDPVSQTLLQNFVFVVIPMLNPDGVYKGWARTDARGVNLQSVYNLTEGKHKDYPGPYAVLEVSKSLASDGRLVLYIDLHAHSNKDGAFVYGTYHQDFKARAEMRVFARLLDLYSKTFDLSSCEYGSLRLLQDTSRAGVAKTEVRKQTGLLHAYTLETSFHVTTKDPNRYSIENNPEKILNKSIMKRIAVKDFMDVGEGINHAILEMFLGNHPKSKLPSTWYGNLDSMRKDVYERLKENSKQEANKEGEGNSNDEENISKKNEGGKQYQPEFENGNVQAS